MLTLVSVSKWKTEKVKKLLTTTKVYKMDHRHLIGQAGHFVTCAHTWRKTVSTKTKLMEIVKLASRSHAIYDSCRHEFVVTCVFYVNDWFCVVVAAMPSKLESHCRGVWDITRRSTFFWIKSGLLGLQFRGFSGVDTSVGWFNHLAFDLTGVISPKWCCLHNLSFIRHYHQCRLFTFFIDCRSCGDHIVHRESWERIFSVLSSSIFVNQRRLLTVYILMMMFSDANLRMRYLLYIKTSPSTHRVCWKKYTSCTCRAYLWECVSMYVFAFELIFFFRFACMRIRSYDTVLQHYT